MPIDIGSEMLLLALGGGILYGFERMINSRIRKQESHIRKIKNPPTYQLHELLKENDEYVLLEGVAQNQEYELKSLDNLKNVIVSRQNYNDVHMNLDTNLKGRKKTSYLGTYQQQLNEFQLRNYWNQVDNEGNSFGVVVQGIGETYIFDDVYNYRCKEEVKHKIIKRKHQPENQYVQLSPTSTIISMGLFVSEDSITVGTQLFVYGRIVYDSLRNYVIVPAPLYIGMEKNKQYIIDQLQSLLNGDKLKYYLLIGVIMAYGCLVASRLISYIDRLVLPDEQNAEQNGN